jgi:hypothetical protein
MSSVLRYTRNQPPINRYFTVFPYYGVPTGGQEYYFTVEGNSLYRIENDLSGSYQWITARDMGADATITSIDIEIIEAWQNAYNWTDITVIRPGRARKYQALAIPNGSNNASLNPGPAWNAAAYTAPSGGPVDANIPYYNPQNAAINDLLIMGYSSTTVSNNYTQNLPWATFWAVVDPVVIQYTSGGDTYTRAIVNRVTPC